MWRPDIVDLGQFYKGLLGQVARRHLTVAIRSVWPDLQGKRLLGIGYATPYLRPFMGEACQVAALMPANQGIHHWPREGPNRAFLSDEFEIPLPDQSIDRILVVHALETSESARHLLREIWRILDADGSALFVAPNRRGLWCRAEGTPFGHGHPYSHGQMVRMLRDCMFQPGTHTSSLHLPPVGWRPVLRANQLLEQAGRRLWPGFAGAHLIEARKQIYAATPVPSGARFRRRREAIRIVAQPARNSRDEDPALRT